MPQRTRPGTRFPAPSQHRTGPSSLETLHEFLAWLFDRARLQASCYRAKSLNRRIPACLRALRVSSTMEARRLVDCHPDHLRTAIDAVLLGVTDYFRDEAVFRAIEQVVVAELQRRPDPVRIWSAACSTGQELRSVAYLLEHHGGFESAELVGTDCRSGAIARAASATLPAKVPLAWACSRFEGRGRVPSPTGPTLRWKVADLFQECEPGPWDMILWRNMAIYLQPGAAESLWAGLWDELRPGGFLVTGKAERPPRKLNAVRVASCIYRKQETPAP